MSKYLLIKRRAYRARKDVKPGRGVRMRTVKVPAATFRIRDRGAAGRGPRVIPPLAEGELTKHGYGFGRSATARRMAIGRSVAEDGYRTTLGRLIALQVFFKRTGRRYSKIAARDRKWLVRKYGGEW